MTSNTEGELTREIVKFNWEVNVDCFKDKKPGEKMSSPSFYTYDLEKKKNKWRLELCPKGWKQYDGWISLYLVNLSNSQIAAAFSLSLLNQRNIKVDDHYDGDSYFFDDNGAIGYERFVENSLIMDPKNDILKDNKIKFLCEIKLGESLNDEDDETLSDKSFTKFQELDRFEQILNNKSFSDVTVIVEEKSLHLHKFMLATYSDYFESSFKSDIIENNTKVIKIEGFKYEVMYELFRFIYTGQTKEINHIVCDLLTAAENFKLEALKVLCEKTMVDNLSKENALDYLNSALASNARNLEADTLNWISLRLGSFLYSPEFQNFGNKHPELLLKIMQKHYSSENVIFHS